jgi:hypothetical protein
MIFTESYENLVQFIFNIYDFNKAAQISRKDIQIVFSYIPLNNTKLFPSLKFKYELSSFNNQLNSQQEINFYLDKIFKNAKFIDIVNFKNIIEEVSSESFLFVRN